MVGSWAHLDAGAVAGSGEPVSTGGGRCDLCEHSIVSELEACHCNAWS